MYYFFHELTVIVQDFVVFSINSILYFSIIVYLMHYPDVCMHSTGGRLEGKCCSNADLSMVTTL